MIDNGFYKTWTSLSQWRFCNSLFAFKGMITARQNKLSLFSFMWWHSDALIGLGAARTTLASVHGAWGLTGWMESYREERIDLVQWYICLHSDLWVVVLEENYKLSKRSPIQFVHVCASSSSRIFINHLPHFSGPRICPSFTFPFSDICNRHFFFGIYSRLSKTTSDLVALVKLNDIHEVISFFVLKHICIS